MLLVQKAISANVYSGIISANKTIDVTLVQKNDKFTFKMYTELWQGQHERLVRNGIGMAVDVTLVQKIDKFNLNNVHGAVIRTARGTSANWH
jgi:hypothetical protein